MGAHQGNRYETLTLSRGDLMRRRLQVAALFIALGAVAMWLITGANRGWTKTSQTRMELDPITEISFPVIEKKFSMGVEILGGAILVAGGLFMSSVLVRKKNNA
jgi:hypothetical protein